MGDFKKIPVGKLTWRRTFGIGSAGEQGKVVIELSEPFEDGPGAWYCAVRITSPDHVLATWIPAHDSLSALARGLHFIEIQQRVLVHRYKDDLFWPLLDGRVSGEPLVDLGFEKPPLNNKTTEP